MTPRKRIAAAALGSVALHALVIASQWLPVAQPEEEPHELQVRLVPLPKMKPAAVPPRTRSPRRATPPPAPPVDTVATAGPVPLPEPQPAAAPAETAEPEAAPETAEPQPPQQLALAAESSTEAARALPRRGRISYTVVYGDTQTYVGKVVQSWRADSGSYELASEAETEGLIDLFRPQRYRYLSKGRITARGLRPESFLMSRTRRGRTEVAEARFDWNAGSLAYGPASAPEKSVPLPPDAQDFLSFIYQFVLTPPTAGHYRVPITTGTRFEVFDIDVGKESPIETPIGVLKALPIRQVPRPGAESIEIWLAAEYRYLPVRIRHFDRDGRYSGEQLVSEIRVSDE